jgi:hypothetical protein
MVASIATIAIEAITEMTTRGRTVVVCGMLFAGTSRTFEGGIACAGAPVDYARRTNHHYSLRAKNHFSNTE